MIFSTKIDDKYFEKIQDYKKSTIKGGFWSFSLQIFNFIFQIITFAILGRMLQPDFFGVVAIVTTFVGFFSVFMEVGFTIAIIQERLDNLLFSTIFLYNIILGLLLTIIFILITPLISLYFNDSRLISISFVFSFIFFTNSLSSPLVSLLKRKMEFKVLAFIQTASSILGFIFGLLFSFFNSSYWILVVIPIATSVIQFVILFFYFKWFPIFYLKHPRIKQILNIGKHMSLFEFVNYFSRNLDNILVGRYFGAESLGVYGKAYQLIILPINQIRSPLINVSLPLLTDVSLDKFKFENYYYKILTLLSLICGLVITFVHINSYEIIIIVLGDKWKDAINILSILSIATIFQPMYSTCGLVLISLGENRKYSRWGVLNAIIIISSFIVGLFFNLEIFSICYLIANVVSFVISPIYTFKDTFITYKKFFTKSLPIVMFYLLICAIMDLIQFPRENYIISLVIKSIGLVILSIIFVLVFFYLYVFMIKKLKIKN